MESCYQESDNEPGHEYFSFRQFKKRLFNEYEWRNQAPSDSSYMSDANETSRESVCSYRGEVKKPQNFTKISHGIQRKSLQMQRNARRVRQFRKWLMPKTALATLQELMAPSQTEVTIYPSCQGIKAEVMVNNVTYEAIDSDKNSAKDKASEQALRDLVFSNGDIPPEDLPKEYLAPFAMHKLLTEWKSAGFKASGAKMSTVKPSFPEESTEPQTTGKRVQIAEVLLPNVPDYIEQWTGRLPFVKPSLRGEVPTSAEQWASGVAMPLEAPPPPVISASGNQNGMPKVIRTVLPPCSSTYHPGVLFAYMRPQVSYQEYRLSREHGKQEFIAAILTDDCCFYGSGNSKKRARKAAATKACQELFGVKFDESML
ncbi:uncharacterized protein LOC128304053 [Anopheles moucheti]|uniref:uncharacterized protein LOC128304053 n=1 Tax=Anopheles moucheti TaxID=186751 RepID=UPI0022F0FB82|nr:uncharacterized protein LOC128304053 [Anopheles moucheti]